MLDKNRLRELFRVYKTGYCWRWTLDYDGVHLIHSEEPFMSEGSCEGSLKLIIGGKFRSEGVQTDKAAYLRLFSDNNETLAMSGVFRAGDTVSKIERVHYMLQKLGITSGGNDGQ